MPNTDYADTPQDNTQTPAWWDGALEEARSLIGVDLRRTGQSWNTDASPDAVRHFCWGIGDDNPLFCAPHYGAATRWRSGLAPGCFLYTIDSTVVAPKLRGIQWLYGGTEWEWFEPIRHRDSFTVRARLLDAVEKRGSKARAFIIQSGEVLYTNQHGKLVCRALGNTARTPRAKAEGGLKYPPREPHRYSAEQLEHIAHAIEDEELRGAVPRHWQDATVGTAIQPMLKGPLNITDMICWYAGGGHSYQSHRRAHMHRQRHPADAFVNADTGAQDSAARGHTESKMAREVGMPGGYDVGTQRISWLGQLMTNWMGDDGFVRKLRTLVRIISSTPRVFLSGCSKARLAGNSGTIANNSNAAAAAQGQPNVEIILTRVLSVSLRRPNIFGDVSWCRGQVVDKQVEDGLYLVYLDLAVVNQLDETTATGTAVVALPSRTDGSAR